MLKKILFLALILIGCSQGKQSETVSDTLFVQEYPVEVPIRDSITAVIQEPVAIDTVFRDITVIEDNPPVPQLDPTIVYVYKKSGVDLYEVNREFKIEKVIGHLDYKAKVQLLSPLNRETPLTVDGMKGYYALAQIEGGRMAYVFSGWLVNLPVPEVPQVFSYFLENIHIERARDNGDSVKSATRRIYNFEQGISLTYRTNEDDILVSVPGMTIQQAWLLANYFMAGLDTFMKQMPTDSAMIRVHPQVYYKVETKKGKVVRIIHEDASGCHSQITFTDTGNGIDIYSWVGC